jgi:hypothetical protein
MNDFQFSFLIVVIIIGFYYVHKELRWIRHAVRNEPTDETISEFFKVLLQGKKEIEEKKKQNKNN